MLAEVERDLISGAHPRGALPGARSSVRKLSGRPKGLPGASSRLEGQLHEHPRAQAEPLPCISARMWSVPLLAGAGTRERLRSGSRSSLGRETGGGEVVTGMTTEALVPAAAEPAVVTARGRG